MLKTAFSISIVLLLLVGLVVAVLILQQTQVFKSQADANLQPVELQITNYSQSSVTISWLTPPRPTIGFVSFGKNPDKLNLSAPDIRDVDQTSGVYKTHYVVLEKLEPATTYYFKIHSDDKLFTTKVNSFTTLDILDVPPSPSDPLFGKVVTKTGSIAGVIIYFYPNGATAPLASTLTSEIGTWTLDLSALRPGGGTYFQPFPDDKITLRAFNGSSKSGVYATLKEMSQMVTLKL